MINPTAAFQSVETRLNTLPQDVFVSEVPEDDEITFTNGLFAPFIVLYNGGPMRSARDHHITSSRNDTTILYWTVEVYAPRAKDAQLIMGNVISLLAAFRPDDSGEMVLEGGMNYSRASNTVRPTMYIEAISFTARSNLSWNA